MDCSNHYIELKTFFSGLSPHEIEIELQRMMRQLSDEWDLIKELPYHDQVPIKVSDLCDEDCGIIKKMADMLGLPINPEVAKMLHQMNNQQISPYFGLRALGEMLPNLEKYISWTISHFKKEKTLQMIVDNLFKDWKKVNTASVCCGYDKYRIKRSQLYGPDPQHPHIEELAQQIGLENSAYCREGVIKLMARQIGVSDDQWNEIATKLATVKDQTHLIPRFQAVKTLLPSLGPFLGQIFDEHLRNPGHERNEPMNER